MARRSWARLTVRRGMILVAVAALILGLGQLAIDRYGGKSTVWTYPVGDLLGSPDGVSPPDDLDGVADRIRWVVGPDAWWPRMRAIVPFNSSNSIIIRQNDAGHREVEAWLRRERSRRFASGLSKQPSPGVDSSLYPSEWRSKQPTPVKEPIPFRYWWKECLRSEFWE